MRAISVFLADDSAIIREGVRAMLARDPDVDVVGVAEDYDSLVAGAAELHPDVVVSDIRMPPHFQREGIDAVKEIRKIHPGTGVVILSQYDDPEYAVSLLSEGSAGYAYLLKDRIAEGDQLARAIREVATGGSMLDPVIVSALDEPRAPHRRAERARRRAALADRRRPDDQGDRVGGADDPRRRGGPGRAAVHPARRPRCQRVRRGRSIACGGCTRRSSSARSRARRSAACCPPVSPSKLLAEGRDIGETERLEVTVLMSDVRGYTSIAEHADPVVLAGQLNRHRAEMNRAVLGAGGTVMQYVGDAVMAVFGAPVACSDHAERALAAAEAMHRAQHAVNEEWLAEGRAPFGLGIGLSTGVVAAALLGSEERVEYTLVGDAVNLCQRLQQFADPGETVLSEATVARLGSLPAGAEQLEPQLVKGRDTPVVAYRVRAHDHINQGVLQ